MSKLGFKVSLSVIEAMDRIKEGQTSELVHEEILDIGDGKLTGTMVFEKYFFRSKNRAALIVILDNLEGKTDLRVISTGSSQGLVFNFDWGAASDFAESVRYTLKDYII
jgi:hypothetical protein